MNCFQRINQELFDMLCSKLVCKHRFYFLLENKLFNVNTW